MLPTRKFPGAGLGRLVLGLFAVAAGTLTACDEEPTRGPQPVPRAPRVAETAELRSADAATIQQAATRMAAACSGDNAKTNLALLARGASLTLREPEGLQPAWEGLAQAVRRCTPQPELLLGAWLSGARPARSAALRALAGLSADAPLSESWLDTMAGLATDDPIPLFFALAQSEALSSNVARRALPLATTAKDNYWATRALHHAGGPAAELLIARSQDPDASRLMRRAALQAWLSLSDVPHAAVLADLVLKEQRPEHLRDLLRALSDTLPEGISDDTKQLPLGQRLQELATLPLEPAAERWLRVDVRCEAAALLHKDPEAPAVLGCDPDLATALALAQVRVLQRTETTTSPVWTALGDNTAPAVEQALLRALADKPPSAPWERTLAKGLQSDAPGTVEVAASLLSRTARQQPDYTVPPTVFAGLRQALTREAGEVSISAQVALIDAAAASRVLSLRQHLPRFCSSPYVAVRRAVNAAFGELRTTDCPPLAEAETPPAAVSPSTAPLNGARTLQFRFISGQQRELTLAKDAPSEHVALLRSWVSDKHFETHPDVAMLDDHVVLLGGPGDGKHGRILTLPELPLPSRIDALSFALRKQGPGAYDAQLAIVLAARPDLDNDWIRLGVAGAEWRETVAGDKVVTVTWLDSTP